MSANLSLSLSDVSFLDTAWLIGHDLDPPMPEDPPKPATRTVELMQAELASHEHTRAELVAEAARLQERIKATDKIMRGLREALALAQGASMPPLEERILTLLLNSKNRQLKVTEVAARLSMNANTISVCVNRHRGTASVERDGKRWYFAASNPKRRVLGLESEDEHNTRAQKRADRAARNAAAAAKKKAKRKAKAAAATGASAQATAPEIAPSPEAPSRAVNEADLPPPKDTSEKPAKRSAAKPKKKSSKKKKSASK